MKCYIKNLTLLVCLPILWLSSVSFTDAVSVRESKWWCGFNGRTVECERNKDGTITPTNVEYLIYRYFSDDFDNAIKVFKCESNLRQFDGNGEVIMSKTGDVGVAQINLKAHLKTAKDLSLDLWDTEQNIQFARLLWNKTGWKSWVCWKIINKK